MNEQTDKLFREGSRRRERERGEQGAAVVFGVRLFRLFRLSEQRLEGAAESHWMF